MNEEDSTLLELMTYAYHNFHLMRDLTVHILENPNSPITHFYQEWCESNSRGIPYPPLNPGTIWMVLTAILVSAKQQWLDIFPSTPISKIEDKWGLKNAEIECEEYTDPPLCYVIQKIRNSFAHPKIIVKPPSEAKITIKKFWTETYFSLEDTYRPGQSFKIRISMSDLASFSSAVYTTISNYVLSTLV